MLPLDDRVGERINPDLAGRPTLIKGSSQVLFGGMGRLSESSVVNIKNKSHAVTAEVVVPESGAEGVIEDVNLFFTTLRDEYTAAANGIIKLHTRRRVGGRVVMGDAMTKLAIAAA